MKDRKEKYLTEIGSFKICRNVKILQYFKEKRMLVLKESYFDIGFFCQALYHPHIQSNHIFFLFDFVTNKPKHRHHKNHSQAIVLKNKEKIVYACTFFIRRSPKPTVTPFKSILRKD